MLQEAISAPCPSIFNGSISSRGALTQKIVDKIIIVYYIFDGSAFLSVSECAKKLIILLLLIFIISTRKI